MENYKNCLVAKLMNQLINSDYVSYVVDGDRNITVGNNSFRFQHDMIGRITICEEELGQYELEDLLKGTQLEPYCQRLKESLESSYEGYLLYEERYKELFQEESIHSVLELMMLDVDTFNNICNRIIDREHESDLYAFMYLNHIPEKYHLMSNLYLDVPFLLIEDKTKEKDMISCAFDGYYPIHPLFLEKHPELVNKYNVKWKKCMMSSSHRTFTMKGFDYYFKIDLPCRISSSMRTLTRSDTRMDASRIAMEHVEEFNKHSKKKLHIFGDLAYYEYENVTVVLRKREKNLRLLPLHALTKELPETNESILDYFIRQSQCDSVQDYFLENLCYPILDVFQYYVQISEPVGKFVEPYNFHRQNIGLVVSQDEIKGIYTQDLDMQYELNPVNVCVEFDCMLTKFIFMPLVEALGKYGIDFMTMFSKIKEYINHNLPLLCKYINAKEVKNKFYILNLIGKDLKEIEKEKYYCSEARVMR